MTKLFYGNQFVKNINLDAKWSVKYVVKLFKRVIWNTAKVCAIAWLMVGALKIGQHYFPETVYAEKVIQVEAPSSIPPVMQRIAKCESGDTQTDLKTGQVLMRSNTNKTVDVGKFQINSVWFKKATELGLDITKEKDNEKMAIWIYENKGTGDWLYSQKCWQ